MSSLCLYYWGRGETDRVFLSFVFRAVIFAEAGSNYNFYANPQDELILAISKSLPYLLSQLLTARHVNQTDRQT